MDLSRFAAVTSATETELENGIKTAADVAEANATTDTTTATHFGTLDDMGRAFASNRSLYVGKAAKASGWDVRATPAPRAADKRKPGVRTALRLRRAPGASASHPVWHARASA